MQRHFERIRKRLALLVGELRSKVYCQRHTLDQLLVSTASDRISYQEAQKLQYRPAKPGEQFGPLWATYWFQGQFTVPPDWAGKRIDLHWVAHYCESTLWMNGTAKQGLNFSFGERAEAVLVEKSKSGQKIGLQIEMACNTIYGAWPPDKPYNNLSPYVLDKCEAVLFDPAAWNLHLDFLVLQQLEADLSTQGQDGAFSAHLLHELNRFANEYYANDSQCSPATQKILSELLKNRNASRVYEISAVGEGHMDIAWWWPVAETRRKIVRTFSSQIALMDAYPEYRFICPQAWVYDELKERLPELYKKLKEKVASGQWIPSGGTWVESDCNLPSGESMVRQFLFGQRFFQEEFGLKCTEGWFQDAFGFSAQLPQLLSQAGIKHFVTQKLMWGELKPAHRLFRWKGLDGSQVLAHVPPRNTFSNDLTVAAINKAAREYEDAECSPRLIMSYGWGDGGGGPTPQMIEIINRLNDLQGVPKTVMRSPSGFFELVEADIANKQLPSWVGELYFCKHRGTYTSQAATKKAMRRAEQMLHDVEFLATIAFKLGACAYPQTEINRLWKVVLLNQFHDILPGTSIKQVHDEAVAQLSAVIADGKQLRATFLQALMSESEDDGKLSSSSAKTKREIAAGASSKEGKPAQGTVASTRERIEKHLIPINTIGFDRLEVAEATDGKLVLVEVPGYGCGKIAQTNQVSSTVTLKENGDSILLENEYLLAQFSRQGDLISLFDKAAQKEVLHSAGNRLQIYDDHPVDYDAWEIEPFHQESVKDCTPALSCKTKVDPLRAEIIFERKIGLSSSMKQRARLDAQSRRLEFHCEVDWKEDSKLLKVLFPAAVQSDYVTYETQFGAVERPTHYNEAYDEARFEVSAHKWADISEHGFGVALLSNSKYGFSTHGNEMRISLLRAPKGPDPEADRGHHEFAYAIMPHCGRWQEGGVVAEAFKFNYPIVWTDGSQSAAMKSFASVIDDSNLVIDTIKKAEDSDSLIIRLYECHGARGTASVKLAFPFKKVSFCNILEEAEGSTKVTEGSILVAYQPFQIITLMIT